MKTILHICDWYHPIGGAEKLLFDTLHLVEDAGHRNVIVYNDHPNQRPSGQRPEYACEGLEQSFSYFYPWLRAQQERTRRRLAEVIAKHNPDVCHIHNLQNPFVHEYLTETLPCVRSIHDPRLYCFTYWRLLPDNRVCPYPLGRECIRQGCISPGPVPRNTFDLNARWVVRTKHAHRKMPVLIGESRAQIECMLENGFPAEQIAWLPNFTPLAPESEVRGFLKAHFDPAEKIVLFVGRASYEKGAEVLLEAARHVRTGCRVVLITAGPLLEKLQRQAASTGGRVQVIPGLPYDETRLWYARSSVVIVPSVWIESFCLVGLEAYANMKPIIGSRIGGIKDWLKDGQTGWFFEPGNASELAAKIDSALADPAALQSMGETAYRRAASYYSSDIYLPRLLDIYRRGIESFNKRSANACCAR